MPIKDENEKIVKQENMQQNGVESIKEEDKEEKVFIQHKTLFKGGEFLDKENFDREETFLEDKKDNEFGL